MSGTLTMMGAGPGAGVSGAVTYSPEAQQFFDRISDPGTTRKNLYATMIDAIVAAGVWAKLDALWMFSAADSATALTSLISATFNATAVNSPTFTVDQGFTNASTNVYVRTNFNPTTATSPKFTQDGNCMFAWSLTSGNNGVIIGNGVNYVLYPSSAGSSFAVLGAGFINVAVANALGFYLGTRRSSTDDRLFKDGAQIGTDTTVSVAPGNAEFLMGDASVNNFSGIAGVGGLGSKLTDGEITSLYNAVHTYMQTVAGVP